MSDLRKLSISRNFLLLNLFLLFAAGTLGIAQASGGMRAIQSESGSGDTVETVREFYLDLNHFMATGEMDNLADAMPPGVYQPAPLARLTGPGSGFANYLLALRATCPGTTFDLQGMETTTAVAIASVQASCLNGSVETAPSTSSDWTANELFQANDGQIQQHWSTAPPMTLQYVAPWLAGEMRVNATGTLSLARLALWSSPGKYLALPGPAVLLVQAGDIHFTGNGLVELVDIGATQSEVIRSGANITVGIGMALVVPRGDFVIENRGTETAALLYAGVVSTPGDRANQSERKEIEADDGLAADLRQGLLGSPDMNVAIDNCIVYPHAVAEEQTLAGSVEMTLSWSVIPPGLTDFEAAEDAGGLTTTVAGEVATISTSTRQGIQNTGEVPALVLRVNVKPV